MKTYIFAALAGFLTLTTPVFGIVITGFGSSPESGASAFTIDTDTTSFSTSVTQNNFNSVAVGNDFGQSFAGTFSGIDITSNSDIQLTALVSGPNPNSNFTVRLFNSSFTDSRLYNGNLSGFGSGSLTTLTLSFVAQTTQFTTIGGFVYTGGGTGDPVNITFDTLAAVPEPSIYALIGIGLAGVTIVSRRKTRLA